ncbi:unnamed protein product, partial [Mesorhabditis spiculigera]
MLFLLFTLANLWPLLWAASNFHPDCADPHNKEISCSVHVVTCGEVSVANVAEGSEPPPAHDVRVEPYARASKHEHQLHVDVSWQMPPSNDSFRIRAFELQVERGSEEKRCFLFNVSNFGLTEDEASPRFHFTSDSLFAFAEPYQITLRSLPRSAKTAPQVVRNATMPLDPDLKDPPSKNNLTAWCKAHSDPQAAKWTAAFRKIFLHSLARTIQIEFVGAPPQYCFEAYEVRLKDESGMELTHSHIVNVADMRPETINGKQVLFGEHNFTNLELDTDYIPSVIPVERSADRRCLCPTQNANPYDNQIVCSCIAADWKKVRLHKIEKPPAPPCHDCINNATVVDKGPRTDHKSLSILIVAAVLAVILMILIYYLFVFYRRHLRQGKAFTLHFKNINNNNVNGGVGGEPREPLIYNSCFSVLLVYSHDCAHHEAAVVAFAEVLRDTFGLKVHMDQWDQDEIEENLNTYINSSVVTADKVIIINSLGGYMRAQARHKKLEPIDLALQHARVVSVRFPYTKGTYTLYALSPLLQYTIPDNIGLLVSSLTECTLRSDPRLSGFDPHLAKLNAAISRMTHFQESDPTWFEKSHQRVRVPLPDTRVFVEADRAIDSGHAVAPGEPIEAESLALLEDDDENVGHEVVPEEPSASSSPRHETADSAYLSGRHDSHDMDSRSSGSERPDDPVISENLRNGQTRIPQRAEDAQGRRKHDPRSNADDSGVISGEFVSGFVQ